MARSQEDMLQELIDGQRSMLGAINRSGSTKTGGVGTSGAGALESGFSALSQTTGGVTSAFSTFAKNILTGSESTSKSLLEFSSSIVGSVPIIGNFQSALKELGAVGLDYVDNLTDSIKYGATFNQNLGLYAQTVLQSRENAQTFNERIKESGTALNILGGTMTETMLRFGQLSKNLQESDVANNLLLSGWSAKELNDVLTTSVTVRRFTDMQDERAKKATILSAQQLAVELDNTARFTGMSREEAKKKLDDDLAKPDVSAMFLTMTEEQRSAYAESAAGLVQFSERVQDLITEQATGGVRSEYGQLTASVMNAQENKLIAILAEYSTKTSPEDREIYNRTLKEFEVVHAQGNIDRAKTAQLLSRSGSDISKAMSEVIKSPAQMGQMNLMMEAARLKISPEELKKQKEQQAELEKRGLTEKGETAPESAAYRGVQAVEKMGRDILAGTSIEMDKLNKKFGESVIQFDTYAKLLQAHSAKEMNIIHKLEEKLGEFIKGTSGANESEGSQTAAALAGGGQWRGAAEPEVQGEWRGTESATPQRADGTVSATGGSLLEDWGIESLVKLHGNEGVITDDQLNKMYSNVSSAMQAGSGVVQPTIQNVSLPPDFMKSIDKTMQGDSYDYGFLIDKLSTQQLDLALSNDLTREKLESMNQKYSGEAHMVDSPGMMRLEARLNQLHDKQATQSKGTTQDQAHNAAMIKYLESISTKTVGIDMGAINETANKTSESLKSIAPGVKIFTDELSNGSAKSKESLDKYIAIDNERAKQSTINLNKELDSIAAKNKETPKSIDVKQPEIAVQPPKESNFFDQVTDIMYDIGNFAGKQYDEITSKFTSSTPKLEHIDFKPIADTNVEVNKTLESLGVTQMKSESSLENFKNSMYEIPDVVGTNIQSAFEKSNDEGPSALDKEIRETAKNFFGQGAKVLSDIPPTSKTKPESSTIEPPKTTANEVTQKQNETVSALTEKQSKEADATTEKLGKMFEGVVLPAGKNEPKEEVRTFEVTTETTTMSDIKTELVTLNTNIRELINRTNEVVDSNKEHARATAKVFKNNLIG